MQAVASIFRERVFFRVHHKVEFPSTDEVEVLDLPHNPTIAVANNSACHLADKDLDVKLPATTKTDDFVLDDLGPTSIPLPHTTMNIIGVSEQLNVSHDLNHFHVFNDNNKMNSNENNKQDHPKIV